MDENQIYTARLAFDKIQAILFLPLLKFFFPLPAAKAELVIYAGD